MRRNNGIFHRLFTRVLLAVGFVRGVPAAVRESQTGETEPIDPTTRFEPGDVNMKAVLLVGAGTLLGLWAIVVLVYPYFAYLEHQRAEASPPPLSAAQAGNPMPPQPRIQENPTGDLRGMRSNANSELARYRWVDQKNGVVSIPIDRAMQIVVERGIPPQPAPPDQTYFDPRAGTRLTGFEGKVEPEPR